MMILFRSLMEIACFKTCPSLALGRQRYLLKEDRIIKIDEKRDKQDTVFFDAISQIRLCPDEPQGWRCEITHQQGKLAISSKNVIALGKIQENSGFYEFIRQFHLAIKNKKLAPTLVCGRSGMRALSRLGLGVSIVGLMAIFIYSAHALLKGKSIALSYAFAAAIFIPAALASYRLKDEKKVESYSLAQLPPPFSLKSEVG